MIKIENKTKHILKGMGLTIIGAILVVFGIVIASTQSLIAGVFIIISSSIFWGYIVGGLWDNIIQN